MSCTGQCVEGGGFEGDGGGEGRGGGGVQKTELCRVEEVQGVTCPFKWGHAVSHTRAIKGCIVFKQGPAFFFYSLSDNATNFIRHFVGGGVISNERISHYIECSIY